MAWNISTVRHTITDGMASAKLPVSDEYGFIETHMVWKVNHMVVPKEKAMACTACHSEKGRLDWKALGCKGDPRKHRK
jgi:hypothetical protein